MIVSGLSPLAKTLPGTLKSAKHGLRRNGVYGITFHTTGGGIPSEAAKKKVNAGQYAVNYYIKAQDGPTYVIDWDGNIFAVTSDENWVTWHVGTVEHGASLKDGSWRKKVSPSTVAAWEKRWGKDRNPLGPKGILPNGYSPNDATVGVEMVPAYSGGIKYAETKGTTRFTEAQHKAAAALAADVARRHGWPSNWRKTRVFGHEDLCPPGRSDNGGGWDPGFTRVGEPWFDMGAIIGISSAAIALIAFGGYFAWRWISKG